MAEEKKNVVEEKQEGKGLFARVNPVLAWSIIIVELLIIGFFHYAVIFLKLFK